MLHKLMWAYELVTALFRRTPPLSTRLMFVSMANSTHVRSALD